MADETHPPKEWNAANVRPFIWTLENGVSTFREQKFPSDRNLMRSIRQSFVTGNLTISGMRRMESR